MFECLEECGANTDCSSSCYRASVVCNDACPCHAGKLFDSKNSEATTFFRLSIWLQTMQEPNLQITIGFDPLQLHRSGKHQIQANAL